MLVKKGFSFLLLIVGPIVTFRTVCFMSIILSFSLTWLLIAQEEPPLGLIQGAVFDANDKHVSGATITFSGPKSGTVKSEDDGFYEISKLPPGQYTLIVTKPNHPTTREFVTIKAGEQVLRNIKLATPKPILPSPPTMPSSAILGTVIEQEPRVVEHVGEWPSSGDVKFVTSLHLSSFYHDVFVTGNILYAASMWGLEIFDISAPAKPSKLGEVPTPGGASDVYVSGNRAYVGIYKRYQVVDITDPAKPWIVGAVALPGKVVYVSGKHAYVSTTTDNRLQVVDVTNPANPRIIGSVRMRGTVGRGAYVSGKHAYVVAENYSFLFGPRHLLQVVDITNPAKPKIIGSVRSLMRWLRWADSVHVSGNYAYVAGYYDNEFVGFYSGLRVVDVSNPAKPKMVGSVDMSKSRTLALGVYASGNHAYVITAGKGLQVVDVTDPAKPKIIARVNTLGLVRSVYGFGNHVYIAAGDQGLQVVDITDPAKPKVVSTVVTPRKASGVYGVSGYHVYVALGYKGLDVVDVSNPAKPKIIGNVRVSAQDVHVSGNYAYVAANSLLHVMDITNPAKPKIISSLRISARDVHVSGNYAYVVSYKGLRVVDLINPPKIIGSVDTPGEAHSLYVSGNHVYIAFGGLFPRRTDGLQVVDVSNPAAPKIIGSVDMPEKANGVYVSGKHAYIAYGGRIETVREHTYIRGGLQVVDVSNLAAPKIIDNVDTPGEARGVYVSGKHAYVAELSKLHVVDVTNPARLKIVGSIDTPGWIYDVYVSDSYIYIADYFDLTVLKHIHDSAIDR